MAGPDYPNAGKCWLATKPDKEETARKMFEETAINTTTKVRVQRWAPGPILISTLAVKSKNG